MNLAEHGWEFDRAMVKPCRFRPEWGECDQHEVELPITKDIVVGCHLDAVGKYEKHPWKNVIEVKSCSKDQFERVKKLKWGIGGYFDKYKWQVSAQHWASGHGVIVAVVNKDDGEVWFLTSDVPHYSKVEITQRVLTVESWVRRGELPDCDINQYPCPFVYLGCTGDSDRVLASREIEELAVRYKAAKVKEDEAGREVTSLRTQLKAACGTSKKLGSDRVKITWYTQRNPPRLDKAKVESLGLDVDSLMTQSESERVRVEVKDEEV